ncbi:Major facilitator superfamily [Globisporangium polare]
MMRYKLRRLCSLLAGVVVMIGVGSLYAISAWNAQLKDLLHYSQAGIATVSSMAMLGSYLSYVPGIIFDRLGPYKSIVIAGAGLLGIHWLMSTALTEYPATLSPLVMGFALILVGQLSAFCIFASIVPNEGIFGEAHRGKVMALLTSSYSCGGAVFAFVYHRGFNNNVSGYFMFLGVFLMVVCVFGWLAFQRNKSQRRDSEVVDANAGTVLTGDRAHAMQEDNDVTGMVLLTDARFWLLFVAILITIGACLFVMSNVSFIVESLGGPMEQVPLMVASFSMSNTAARLVTGAVSDHFVHRYPRALFAGISVVMTATTLVMFLVIPAGALIVPVTMAGISEGVMFGTFPVIIREAFGLKHFGKNYGLISFANCIGYPFIFSPLSSFFYERSASASVATMTDEGTHAMSGKCLGAQCFRPVFLLAVALCAVALFCCVKLLRLQNRIKYHAIP